MSESAPPVLRTTHAADEVIPLFSMDTYRYTRVFSGSYKWVINGTLDVETLRHGLDTLANRGTWRKFGARIRQNSEGDLEWHVPRQYTKERPAYHLTVHTYASVAAANLFIPTPTRDAPSIQPNMGPDVVFVHPDTPIKLEEYLDPAQDHPCFNLHVSLFRDDPITCIGITLPHIYGDGVGVAKMLSNWLTLMRNPNAPIPVLHGYDTDPLAPLEASYDFAEDLTTEKWEETLRNITSQEVAEDRPREYRTVYLPGSHVKRMRAEALAELRQRQQRGEAVPDFLSENDIIIAWWIKVLHFRY
ncbi:hypothetical protein NEOLEDRAFT_801120 [Neolentinus lepideus HHB14362 ss-1]|uniref:Uncharacterized protein n=1 Tax=Neolentinus lepideus HHB14362 ss-1 TaxID=1314782 RepID=A0A165PI77_9AGAM|nr:hypothetical protein NEOLEDRAFT_801120 [Neolentinus lepideus HHB14362 ss-1]